MAQASAKVPLAQRIHWDDFIKPWIIRLLFVGVGLLIGLYILAPRQNRAADSYLPSTYTDIPTGLVQFTNEAGVGALLPVRIADTTSHRNNGFNDVGLTALNNNFLLYAQTRESSRATSYRLPSVRAQLELAVISDEGQVIALQEAAPGIERFSVAENHRWLLAARAGTFEVYGIMVGSVLDPESIQKISF